MTRNNPSTSIDAFRQVTPDMLRGHYLKIINALQSLGTCNYEKIADFVGMDRHAVGRRLKEMEGLELIYKPGTTSLTKSNRKAFNYCLTGAGMPKTEKEITYRKGEKASSDYSKQLIQSATQLNLL